jgi:hypothetical protein
MERNDSWPACDGSAEAWSHVCSSGPVTLAASVTHAHRVPNLQLYLLPVDVDHARPELHADSQVVDWLKALVGELEQEA